MSTGARERGPLVALTGGIASGKTAVSDRLAELGATVIDTDVVARDVVAPGQAGLAAIVSEFGPDMIDAHGALRRAALRELVFAVPERRRKLDALLHPLIEARVRAQLASIQQPQVTVLVVPLLVETGLFNDADLVVVVDVPEALQIERLNARDLIDQEAAKRMLAAQASRQQRLAHADTVLDNSSDLSALYVQVDALYRKLLDWRPDAPGDDQPTVPDQP